MSYDNWLGSGYTDQEDDERVVRATQQFTPGVTPLTKQSKEKL